MVFNQKYLDVYKELIQTTDLQKGYQEFIGLFRFLRVELEKEMPEYRFSGNIVENSMDYAYFQFTNDPMKRQGLKVVVAFLHKEFLFEVWISGCNRNIQCEYYERLKNMPHPFFLNDNPSRIDYILRYPIGTDINISNGNAVLCEIKRIADELVDFILSK